MGHPHGRAGQCVCRLDRTMSFISCRCLLQIVKCQVLRNAWVRFPSRLVAVLCNRLLFSLSIVLEICTIGCTRSVRSSVPDLYDRVYQICTIGCTRSAVFCRTFGKKNWKKRRAYVMLNHRTFPWRMVCYKNFV